MRMMFRVLGGVPPGSNEDWGALADIEGKARGALVAHGDARRALAVALATDRRDTERHAALTARAADLEGRAIEAARAGRDDLARAAAEAIAFLEDEASTAAQAVAAVDAAVARMRGLVEDQRRRLAAIDRGRRLATVRAALSRRIATPCRQEPLVQAEEALEALASRQDDAETIAGFCDDGSRLVEDMAEAGFGPSLRPMPRDVLARIRAKAGAPSLPATIPLTSQQQTDAG